jgi:predicted nucleic acid-binding protein
MKLVIAERETAALASELDADTSRTIVSSWLLHTELHCAAGRHPEDIDPARVNAMTDLVILVDITRGDLISAGTHTPLRSHDAIHLAVALRLAADEIITYDAELADAAGRAGLTVLSPS